MDADVKSGGAWRLPSNESEMLDSMFGELETDYGDDGIGLPDVPSADGFAPVTPPTARKSGDYGGKRLPERSGSSFMETRMVPFTLMTDGSTATQVMMLLEMIRYCMENSKGVVDAATGEAKEYEIRLKVRNRGRSDFLVSVGDEPMAPLPPCEDGWTIGS